MHLYILLIVCPKSLKTRNTQTRSHMCTFPPGASHTCICFHDVVLYNIGYFCWLACKTFLFSRLTHLMVYFSKSKFRLTIACSAFCLWSFINQNTKLVAWGWTSLTGETGPDDIHHTSGMIICLCSTLILQNRKGKSKKMGKSWFKQI